ncbi:MAG: class I SAM-dependent methyltransferase [Anaerolineae bacterium]|jgi:SAM-dependent methyltransferase|nr:class I SAM-dependent methyltransferase [Anaerolineae bacterium]
MTTEPTWKKYLTDYNEGLGLVYERFVLNDFLLELKGRYGFANALEAPLYGMAGVSGINSVALARVKTPVTLLDDNAERLEGVKRIWAKLALPAEFGLISDWSRLPFPDNTFEFAWNWAAIWHLPDPAALLSELVRVSNKLVFVATPNPVQVGYQMRKHIVEPEFVKEIDERWTNIGLIRETLERQGVRILEQGVLDTPPWPDTVMPASELLKKLGVRSKKLDSKFTGEGWRWSTMDYYLGNDYGLYDRVMKYARLERWRLPWQIKQVWSHHRWVLGKKTT